MLNFLYCCDENYNLQFQTSLFSLLENVNENINIYVLYKKGFKKQNISNKISNHKNLENLNFVEFRSEVKDFPNINDAHVSEATYYRLFVDEHINNNIENLIYLDADIVCLNNPVDQIYAHISEIKSSDNIISVRTEHSMIDSRERLGMTSRNYFNAGVMIIDYKKWLNQNIGIKLREYLLNNSKDLDFWDQDILNMFFDGNYFELHRELNVKSNLDVYDKEKINIYDQEIIRYKDNEVVVDKFLHFAGKFKPWSLKGILNIKSKPYHDTFNTLFEGEIHLQYNWKGNVLKDLITSTLSLKIFLYKKPLKLIFKVIRSLFKRNEKF